MMSAAQQQVFNFSCCNSGCEPVTLPPAVPVVYEIPLSEAVHGLITRVHTLNGSAPFNLVYFTPEFEFISFILSGNNLNISVDTTATSVFQTNVAYPITYTVQNCAGNGELVYSGTIKITA